MAAYLGDPREGRLSHERSYALEFDNHDHPHYQWGAMILDLCGMDPEEYSKTIFNTSGSNSGGGSVKKNSIKLTTDVLKPENEAGEAELVVNLSKAATSDFSVFFTLTSLDGEEVAEPEVVEVPIKVGEKEVRKKLSNVRMFKSMVAKVTVGTDASQATTSYEDDNSKYQTSPIIKDTFKAYYGVFLSSSDEEVTIDNLLHAGEITENGKETSVQFLVDCYEIEDYPIDGTDEEIDAYLEKEDALRKETCCDFIVIAPKGATFKAVMGGLGDDTADFTQFKEENDMVFYKKEGMSGDDAIMCGPKTDDGNQLAYDYVLTITKN